MPDFAVGAPGEADVEAVLGVVRVVLVPPDQHVGKARLAHPSTAHDQNARTGEPEMFSGDPD